MIKTILRTVFVISVAAACSKAPVNPYPTDTGLHAGVNQSAQQDDWSAILILENQAKAIAKVSGCATSDCKAAPVGSRACGGPRYYLPYCARTTDSVALYGKLDEVAKAEQAYNRTYKIVSTCIFLMPPQVEAVGGSCVAK